MVDHTINRRQTIKGLIASGTISLAGCMSSNNEGDEEDVEEEQVGNEDASIELRFDSWGSGTERNALEQGLSGFTEENENISVVYQNVPYDDYHDRLQTQFGANEEPDTFYIDMNYVGSFAANDVLVDLSEEFDEEFMEGFDNNMLDEYRGPDGGLHMVPHASAPLIVGYNADLLSEVGYDEFPETWDEFESALEALRDQTDVTYPLVEQGTGTRTAWIWYPWVYANGGQIMNDDRTECVVASEECVEALEYFQRLRNNDLLGIIPTEIGAEEDEPALVNGEIAMGTGGATIPANIRDQYPDFYDQLAVARPPRPSDGEFGNVVSGAGFAVSENTEYRDETISLVEYMLVEGIVPYLETGVSIPIRESHREEINLIADDERYQTMVEMTDDPRMGSLNWGPHTQEIYNELYPQLEGVIQGEVEPRDALETVENTVNNEILSGE